MSTPQAGLEIIAQPQENPNEDDKLCMQCYDKFDHLLAPKIIYLSEIRMISIKISTYLELKMCYYVPPVFFDKLIVSYRGLNDVIYLPLETQYMMYLDVVYP